MPALRDSFLFKGARRRLWGAAAALWWLALAVGPAPAQAHEHHAPHQGSLQSLGEDVAHLELLMDPRSGRLIAWALDGEAEGYERLAQGSIRIRVLACVPARAPFDLVLRPVANALTGESAGSTSQFEAVSPKLAGLRSFSGLCGPLTIRGVRFRSVRIRYPEGNE